MAYFSVRKKILLSLLAITLLFGVGMVLFAETVIYHKLHEKLKEKGVALARRAAADCVDPVITEQYFQITMMFRDLLSSQDDIVYAFVLDEEGRDLAHTFVKGVPQALKLAHKADPLLPYSSADLSTDKGLVHDIAVPLLNGQIGELHLGLSDAAIRNDVTDILKVIVLFSALVLIAGAAASIGFSRTITGPLMKLAGAAEAFGQGEMNHVDLNSNDEVGDVAKVFNSMVDKRKQTEAERERLIVELQTALENVKTLSGLLPLCSSCKKIRDDKGYWSQIEAYVSEHSDAEFSHSLCPDCAQKLYPEIWEKIQKEKG